MDERDDTEFEPALPPAALDTLGTMIPPRGFAQAAIRAAAGRHSWPWTRVAAATVLVGLCASAVLALDDREKSGGAALATSRRAVEIGNGTTAVLEAGSRVHWSRTGGATRVEQDLGNVFYRVDDGGPFSLEAAGARISGAGAAFRVEIDPMNHKKSLAAVGAVAAAGILVATVYEGTIDIHAQDGVRSVGAGQVVTLGESRASVGDRAGDHDSDRQPVLLASAIDPRLREAQQDALDLQRRIDDVERALADATDPESAASRAAVPANETAEERAERCFTRGGIGCSFVDPDQGVLERLARHCNVWVDQPDIFDPDAKLEPSAQLVEDAGLSPEEAAALATANRDYVAESERRMKAAFIAMGGAAEIAEAMPTSALEGMMWEMVSEEDSLQIIAAVARERAGQPVASPALDTPGGRWMRAMLDGGTDYESFLAGRLGPENARTLRRLHDGWGNKSTFGKGSCPE